ncbi:hypothetical protein R5R35_001610 [Gryllus longicercus]|uniref:DDE Tnp4 domain-containing protein n=1 Tax=Gryllus longicercus TaxID=2509291 RepID=A0AAN9Z5R3_9ORTH
MSTVSTLAAACAALIILKKRRKRKRQMWVKNVFLRREEQSVYKVLMAELREEDEAMYKNFVRVTPEGFDLLLGKISQAIKKQDTVMRKSISCGERLALTLRFLATGDTYSSLSYLFRIPVCTISKIIPEVCSAILECLKDYFKVPTTEDEWLKIAGEFSSQWDFPNCIGALDGKHIHIQAPAKTGSLYFNYKGTFSIVLLALVDANYKFLYTNIGAPGHHADGGIFATSNLNQAIEQKKLNIPNARPLPGRHMKIPYVIVADDAFALQANLMKPFKHQTLNGMKRVYNYRLSRARRIVENAFGMAAARFRILLRSIELPPEKVKLIVGTICVLHNFLLSTSGTVYAPPGTCDRDVNGIFEPGSWRNGTNIPFLDLQPTQGRNYSTNARVIRNEFKEYFVAEGEVPWQYKCI